MAGMFFNEDLDQGAVDSDVDSDDASSDGDSDEISGPLPFDKDHPTKHVPWHLKHNNPEIIEAWTVVHNCAISGNSADMDEYLPKLTKEELNQWNFEGETPLFIAAFRGHVKVLQKLLEVGADPSIPNPMDRTPLMTAVQNCHVECVAKLLEHGVDPDEKNESGYTALFSAACLGIGPHLREFVDCPHMDSWMNKLRNGAILKMLLKKGVDVNCQSKTGHTPLYHATINDNPTAVRLLLEHGADPRHTVKEGLSIMYPMPIMGLHFAAEKGYTECLHLLLEKFDRFDEFKSKNTPMHCAVRKGCLSSVKCLVEAGFDVDTGLKLPEDELAQYKASTDAWPVLATVDTTNVELVQYVLSKGASSMCYDLPVPTCPYTCPLFIAFQKSFVVLRLLLEHCAEMKDLKPCRHIREFPLCDVQIWQQPIENFEHLLQVGLGFNFDLVPVEILTDNGWKEKLEEVARLWWQFVDYEPTNSHLLQILGKHIGTPRTLSHLSRVAVRRSIGFPRLVKPSLSILRLPVPQHLHDYLLHR